MAPIFVHIVLIETGYASERAADQSHRALFYPHGGMALKTLGLGDSLQNKVKREPGSVQEILGGFPL